jgi:type I site-specific restriction-modification system R (restriction) subunit
MNTTDTTEKGLEALIEQTLMLEAGYEAGNPNEYNREYAVDLTKLAAFIQKTQPEIAEKIGIYEDTPKRTKFLHRLQGEIARKGCIEVLRKGVSHEAFHATLFYGSPTANNEKARVLFEQNIFSVTRQLRYSTSETQLALDMVVFINGLPIATFELKNRLTKQIFPRYHQLSVVRKLLADAESKGAGIRYLIQQLCRHGKLNSIAWLAHQLVSLEKEKKPVFGSVIVVTDAPRT